MADPQTRWYQPTMTQAERRELTKTFQRIMPRVALRLYMAGIGGFHSAPSPKAVARAIADVLN